MNINETFYHSLKKKWPNFSTQILAFTLSKDPEEMKINKVMRNKKNQPKTETWEEKQKIKIQLP